MTFEENAVWASVAALWPGLEALRTGSFLPARAVIAEGTRAGRSAESAGVLLAAAAVSHHVAQSFAPERRKQLVGELKQILSMSFEEARKTPVDPFVHRVVTAWQTVRGWSDEGRVEQDLPGLFLRDVVHALNH
jgi:hypothetical protein